MARVGLRCMTVLALTGAVAGLVAAVDATTGHMTQLPLHSRFGCANCHAGATTTQISTPALNPFGVDFRNNGMVWNAALAALDSDGDGCRNGAELGDVDGNGQPDVYATQESSNPGVPDCTAEILDEQSWGALKSLFNAR